MTVLCAMSDYQLIVFPCAVRCYHLTVLNDSNFSIFFTNSFHSTELPVTFAQNQIIMGKGDKRSKKGKLIIGSKGKTRPARPQNVKARAEAVRLKKD
jgi:ribosomal small subunit protein bTHX